MVITIIFHAVTLCITEVFKSLHSAAITLVALKAPAQDILWCPSATYQLHIRKRFLP